jgi:acid phosphatase (class A)
MVRRNTKSFLLTALGAGLLWSAFAWAGNCTDGSLFKKPLDPTVDDPEATRVSLNYLTTDAVDPKAILPGPPDAVATRAELDEMLDIQSKRTEADCVRARVEVKNSVGTFFGPPYGSLTAAEAAALEPLFVKVRGDMNTFVQSTKKIWDRARPWIEEPKLTPCVLLEHTGAYPSGHSAGSHIFALLLGQLNPKRAAAVMADADRVAADRVLSGLHHPSDTDAGKKLADAVWQAMQKQPSFQSDLVKFSLP